MNIAKSIKVAMAMQDHDSLWLAEQLGVSRSRVNQMKLADGVKTTDTVEALARVFGMSASEFIAIGEE